MNTDALDAVRMRPAGPENFFVHDRETGKLIGRVWQEANGEWWATFYLGEGRTAINESGGKFDTQGDAVAEVWARSQDS